MEQRDWLIIMVIAILIIGGAIGGAILLAGDGDNKAEAEMTVLDAELRATDTYDLPPDEGHEYLYLQVEIENKKEDEDLSLNAFNFELVTEEGGVYTYNDYEGKPDGVIAGDTATFWISFEIPENEVGDTLRYEPDWIDDKTYTGDVPPYADNGTEEKQLELEISDPQAHETSISIKATITGEQGSYDLTLTSPDGSTESTGYITESEMDDGEHAVWLSMGGYKANPNTGEYKVSLSESLGSDVLKEKNFTYKGVDVTVNDANFTWNTYEYYDSDLDSIDVNVSNSGDAGYITDISVTINETTETSFIDGDEHLPANSDEEFTASTYFLESDSGSHEAEIKLLDNSGSTLATYTTTVNVP